MLTKASETKSSFRTEPKSADCDASAAEGGRDQYGARSRRPRGVLPSGEEWHVRSNGATGDAARKITYLTPVMGRRQLVCLFVCCSSC